MQDFSHTPVLLNETLDLLNVKPTGTYLDCTLGGGGHSAKILEKLTTGHLIALDRDKDSIAYCRKKFEGNEKITIVHSNYKQAASVLLNLGINGLDGVLADLGISSYQIDNPDRGFSYMKQGPLDMRMDTTQQLTAFEVVNEYSKDKLIQIFRDYADEKFAREIAQSILVQRRFGPIRTTADLVDIVDRSIPMRLRTGHSSKKVFQAIRIEVNQELEGLKDIFSKLIAKLNNCGRMAVIAFHSAEDKIVKDLFKECATGCICPKNFPVCVCGHKATVKLITKKPIEATEQERRENSRSNSAKLRGIEKI